MADPQLVFDNAVEGMFIHALHDRMTPRLKAQLRDLGIDLDKKLRPGYERETWAAALDLTTRELFPGQSVDEAARQLGVRVTSGYDRTLMGKALLHAAKMLGPKRTLVRLTRSMRASNTYVSATLVERGPTDFEVQCTGLDLSPWFMAGILEAALEHCEAKKINMSIESAVGDQATLRVSWAA